MKKLYLDFNVISYLRSGLHPALTTAFNDAAKAQLVVFSPAHLEDIAASAMRDGTAPSITKAEIEFLSKIAGRNALRPVTRDQVDLYDESPQDCYARVVDQYDNNEWAERMEAAVIADAHDKPTGSPKQMNNIPPVDILGNIVYRELIARALYAAELISKDEQVEALFWRFDDLKNRFSVLEASVSLAANMLEKMGYYREARSKSRARLHDVSHIIYAAYCDTFVTADEKLAKKAQAIYSLLGISTQVLLDKKFVAQVSPPLRATKVPAIEGCSQVLHGLSLVTSPVLACELRACSDS
ncbi:hypothetical protein O3301_28190 [Janthinobacterium sp. SUN211]|uniref:hypothetical protein n=1 Tax=Janthinobacterium sp. SUN211 TaxID=3014786 RepID=UPI002712F981|nr:hypothetical protein [Janthinobacterium sp. SUN211]MDO8052354.1 hypothetical protein [Janthinobacterium sp. SUN211]